MVRRASIIAVLAIIAAFGVSGAGPFSPFEKLAPFSPFTSAQSGILTLTNAQKLSLPANTPVGTRVQVTDGFVANGAEGATDGFFFYQVPLDVYLQSLPFRDDDSDQQGRWFPDAYGGGGYWAVGSNCGGR